jgi:Malectin domain
MTNDQVRTRQDRSFRHSCLVIDSSFWLVWSFELSSRPPALRKRSACPRLYLKTHIHEETHVTTQLPIRSCAALLGAVILAMISIGCNTTKTESSAAAAVSAKPAEPLAPPRPTIRIDAGAEVGMTDSQGVKWEADTGFDGGETVDRPDLPVTGTSDPRLYQTERYSMNHYTFKVPNGRYLLRLHFSEDYEGNTEPDMRLFTYAVKDGAPKDGKVIREVKDFSPWKASGAHSKAYIDNVPINVTAGQISITFTANVENPQVNAIEIVPQ